MGIDNAATFFLLVGTMPYFILGFVFSWVGLDGQETLGPELWQALGVAALGWLPTVPLARWFDRKGWGQDLSPEASVRNLPAGFVRVFSWGAPTIFVAAAVLGALIRAFPWIGGALGAIKSLLT